MHKLIIIGSGPAGLTAGTYAARAKLAPLIFSGPLSGGQLIKTTVVENWPGADEGILGSELMERMKKQAEKFGAKTIDKAVNSVDFSGGKLRAEGEEAGAVIIATGAVSRFLNIPGEKELLGRGVATCAVCDAPFYQNKTAMVVGGGDAACEDALALTKFAKQVYLIVRKKELKASKIMADRVKNNPKIKIFWENEVEEIIGGQKVEAVKLKGGEEVKTDGFFLAVGHIPASQIFRDKLEMDEEGYIKIGRGEYPTMTSVEGVFAAGDVVDKRYKQAITASAMGCQAAIDVERYLENE
ncbi:MAG: thioredoxin-disulfide reductase [Candidatus Beckwithbacteria bacterium]